MSGRGLIMGLSKTATSLDRAFGKMLLVLCLSILSPLCLVFAQLEMQASAAVVIQEELDQEPIVPVRCPIAVAGTVPSRLTLSDRCLVVTPAVLGVSNLVADSDKFRLKSWLPPVEMPGWYRRPPLLWLLNCSLLL